MALISAKTILTSLCLFHITLAYFFYTNPNAIADQALVWVLGEAMGMPQTTFFDTPSPASSFLGIALLLVGLSDLLTLSLPTEIWLVHHWSAQAPLRITFFLALSLFAFLTAPAASSAPHLRAGPPSSARLAHPVAPLIAPAGGGADGLRNRVFFTFAFVEFLSWFWAWVTLREEARELLDRKRAAGARRGSSGGGGVGVGGGF
ncbi:increased loss of mitochondrial DNA protein 1 [Xylariaceae sp. FL0662B]|nr:increased loss of mitochondrial DNA protein 1 [Xylariaceae sp. FL0662B]